MRRFLAAVPVLVALVVGIAAQAPFPGTATGATPLTPQQMAEIVKTGQGSYLTVTTNLQGAEVWVDGRLAGRCVMAFQNRWLFAVVLLRKGTTERVVEVRAAGYKTQTAKYVPDGTPLFLEAILEKDDSSPQTSSTQNTPAADLLSDEEVRDAIAGKGKDHWVLIEDMGLTATYGTAFGGLRHIILAMPEAVIGLAAEQAAKSFTTFQPTEEAKQRSLTILAYGNVAEYVSGGCESVTRVVLSSEPTGGVVEEAYLSEPSTQVWSNAFGASNYCQVLKTKFSMAAVQRVRSAAKGGEFYVTVFAGNQPTKTYKIKHKHQAKLGWGKN